MLYVSGMADETKPHAYRSKDGAVVNAHRVTTPAMVGDVLAQSGDWVVTADDVTVVVKDESFKQTYELTEV